MQKTREKLVRNTIYNALGYFWTAFLGIVFTPYIIHYVGIERYGVWIVISVLIGYFGLLDFGFGTSFIKYISEYYTKNDYKNLNNVLSCGFIFYLAFSILAAFFSCLFIKFLMDVVRISTQAYSEARFVFIISIVLFTLTNTFKIFPALCDGLQRMDITNKTGIVTSFIWVVAAATALKAGYGLRGLIFTQLISYVLYITLIIMTCYKILPQLQFNLFSTTKQMYKRLFYFGIKLQAGRFAELINFQMNKILISYFLNVGVVTFYELGSRITSTVRSIPLIITTAIVPAASEIDAREDKDALYQLYLRSSKYLVLVGVPLVFFVIITAYLIMLVWMGQGYELSARVIQLLSVGYLANLLTGIMASMVQGMGRPEYLMRQALLQAILNIILGIILVIRIGVFGACIGTTVSLLAGAIYFCIIFHKFINKPLIELFRKVYLLPFVCSGLASATVLLFNYHIHFSQRRLINIGILCIDMIIFACVYLGAILMFNYLDKKDKSIFKELYESGIGACSYFWHRV